MESYGLWWIVVKFEICCFAVTMSIAMFTKRTLTLVISEWWTSTSIPKGVLIALRAVIALRIVRSVKIHLEGGE